MTVSAHAATAALASASQRASDVAQVLRHASVNGPVFTQVASGWLRLVQTVPVEASRLELWNVLRLNALAWGGARLAANPYDGRVIALADVALDDGADVSGFVAAAGDGMRALAGAVAAARDEVLPAGVPTLNAVEAEPGALATLLRDLPWSFVERSPRRAIVDLDVPDRFSQASVETSDGLWRAFVRLPAPATSASTRQALALMLLTLTGALRLVRACAVSAERTEVPTLEVSQPGPATGTALHHALSSLSVGVREVGAEARALNCDAVAEAYLTARGRAA
jgi:hypothetical protein